MSLKSSASPHLPTLSTILERYSQRTGEVIEAHAQIVSDELVDLALTNAEGGLIPEPSLIREFMSAVTELLADGALPSDCDIRLQTTEEEIEQDAPQTISDEMTAPPPAPQATQDPGNPGDLSAAPQAHNDGMQLRKALIDLGHSKGHRVRDIDDAETKRGGKTLPEVRFFHATVREGKVGEGPCGDIVASSLEADFGAELFGNTPVQLAPATPQDVVQPQLANKNWVELAHDPENLYAVDLAPGAAGEVGQVIGRSIFTAEVPHLVARSLSQFVTGDWVPTAYKANSSVAPAQEAEPQEITRWGTVTSVLEPSVEAVSAIEDQPEHAAPAAPDHATWVNPWVTDSQPQPVKPAEGLVEELEESPGLDPAAEPDVVPNPQDNLGYRSQINSLLGRAETAELTSSTEKLNHNPPSTPSPADQTSQSEKEAVEDFATIAFGAFNPQGEHPNTLESTPSLGTAAENPEYGEPTQATRHSRKNSEQPENSFMAGLRKFFLG
ncbi:MAG: hypothetical protein Q3974_00350 [Rothia sp. (in: high G+C Gram-positive bacteria)]|nr:hypothetical protein [Rothia sp. (in: high G+C Gram-positive bacteria)]